MIISEVIGTPELQARFNQLSTDMHNGVARAIFALTIELQRMVKQDKLSGQVLNTRTSNLRNSIAENVTDNGSIIEGTVGTNVSAIPYARIHEFGGEIKAKRAKFLRFKIGNRWISKKSVTIPERSYLRSALKDLEPKIREVITDHLKEFRV